MFGLGTPELIVIGVIVFFIFGAKRLPEIGKGLGGAIREFKKVKKDLSPNEKEGKKPLLSLEEKVKAKVVNQIPGVKQAADIKKKLLIFAFFISFWIGSPVPSPFAQIQGAEAVLSGLTTCHPIIRYVEDDRPRASSPMTQELQSNAEKMLVDAGITIVDQAEFNRLLGAKTYPVAMLEMDVRISLHQDLDIKSYLLTLSVRQPVFLTRKPVVRFLGTTWESTDFGIAKDLTFVRRVAGEALGRFIQEWKAQNAK
ncbi:MAG: twin-arginine translocase TatA/TatE family subunit [Deltaproteobacteria bacterium]|nr:twin-arginine translocase TatA/TatE family subunit [Deltaproteobacteria bacterium]